MLVHLRTMRIIHAETQQGTFNITKCKQRRTFTNTADSRINSAVKEHIHTDKHTHTHRQHKLELHPTPDQQQHKYDT